jgi:SprT protein
MSTYLVLVEKNKEYIDLANNIYGTDHPYPKIRCDINGKRGGWAHSSTWTVNYNPHFLKNHTASFLKQTVGHEIAHLIADKQGSHGHDAIWQNVMYRFGLEPNRCHSYDATALPKYVNKMYTYTCGCTDFPITPRIHAKILQGRWRKCNKCNGRLELKSIPNKIIVPLTSIITPIFVGKYTTQPSPFYLQQVGNELKQIDAATVLLNQGKKITNKSIVTDIVLKYSMSKTDAEIIAIIQSTLNVTLSNAKTYLYNHRRK